jgi:hypothetical protein
LDTARAGAVPVALKNAVDAHDGGAPGGKRSLFTAHTHCRHSVWGTANPAFGACSPRHQVQPDAARQVRPRVLGYDNAHAVKPPKKFKFAGQRLPYSFKSAYQLLEDFFAEVYRLINESQQ